MEFKIGDRVKVIKSCRKMTSIYDALFPSRIGKIGIITEKEKFLPHISYKYKINFEDNQYFNSMNTCLNNLIFFDEDLKLIDEFESQNYEEWTEE